MWILNTAKETFPADNNSLHPQNLSQVMHISEREVRVEAAGRAK
jgi:hypothetical protein